ncbi:MULTISPECIES: CidA/LrgA family protein [Neobacillus]|uniref:CidA/LrgA family protein n=1 Tax=Neobacillus rhizophilus TaxID=2833579 RepID=A0A942U1G8_9BACI|nr:MULTISPECIES: CidA/LrgA family protein [Neobacillus]MBS4211027.1 CidA/LrgA family protein [Neobacillus rhizophilus]
MVRYFVQFITILLIYLIGNGLVRWLDLPVPGSIVGMALLFLGLTLKVCKLKWVEAIAQLHIKHITLLFIPFAVGVWHYTGIFRIEGLKLTAILAASSISVLLVTAGMAEFFEIKTKKGRQNGKND